MVIRGLVIFIIGIFYSGGFTNPWPDMRLLGVLQRIALAYGGGEAVAQEITVTAKPPGAGTRAMIEGGEPIALGTYYRWTEGRQQQPH